MKPPFPHQTEGVARILATPRMLLADEMRLGKTRQAIDAAQQLWASGLVRRVLVLAPAPVIPVWADPDSGQVMEYLTVPAEVTAIRAGEVRTWRSGEAGGLEWYVSNYELMRRKDRFPTYARLCGPDTLLVLDESSCVKSPEAQQTRLAYELARKCGRVLLLNGTPYGDNPGDLYSQAKILSPDILGCTNWYQFQSRYAIMGGYRRLRRVLVEGKWVQRREPVQVVGWTNLEDLYRRMAPYVLRRTMAQVFKTLPPRLDPVPIHVPLDAAAWQMYQAMKRDALVALADGTEVVAPQAAVKVMRLAQLTSGLLGDQAVNDAKLGAVVEWHNDQMAQRPDFRVIYWCRFRLEAERLAAALSPVCATRLLYGSQKPEERSAALALLGPGCDRTKPAALVGVARTGGMGLDLSGAATVVFVSNEYSLLVREQAEARPLGPNQLEACAYFDVVAQGPKGQRTIDHAVLEAHHTKQDLAAWTAREWVKALED